CVGEAVFRYVNRYPEAFSSAWTGGVGSARIAPPREPLLTPLTRTFRRRAHLGRACKVWEALAFLGLCEHDSIAQFA
ncbi:amidase, partial [Paenarthrobacter nicotinovorans]